MKLTKLQRYTIYCIIHYELSRRVENKKNISGICSIIAWDILGYFSQSDVYWGDLINLLKELKAKRELKRTFWFKNDTQRLAALKQCIEETHPSI